MAKESGALEQVNGMQAGRDAKPSRGPAKKGRSFPIALALVMLLPVAMPIFTTEVARADSASILSPVLPTGRALAGTAWDGTNVYIFGGLDANGPSNQIVRYTPSTNAVATMGATLPTAVYGTTAIWDGAHAYIFGGESGSGIAGTQIVQYAPSTDTVTTMGAVLPVGVSRGSAIWDGTDAYIFGGCCSWTTILRYSPATDAAATMNAQLPGNGAYENSAIWDGTNAYIFGVCCSGGVGNLIVRYAPSTDTATTMAATIPEGRQGTSAVWDGSAAYIFGGIGPGAVYSTAIVRYTPASDATTTMGAALPVAAKSTSAVMDGAIAYIFGGYSDANGYSDQITQYTPTPGAPHSLAAVVGPGPGRITLNWQAPAANTFTSPITGYKIYRGTNSGEEAFETQVGNVLSYDDTGLANSQTYYYTVSAINAVGEGIPSNEASSTTHQPPGAPQDLAAAAGPSARQITLSWEAPSSTGGLAITNYRVLRSRASGGPYSQVAQLEDQRSYTDAGLALGDYYYRVTAVNPAGDGPASGEASASAVGAPSVPGQSPSPIVACGTEANPFVLQEAVTYEVRPSPARGTCFFTYAVVAPGRMLQLDATPADPGPGRFVQVMADNGAASKCTTNPVVGSAALVGRCRIVDASGTYVIQAHYPENTPYFTMLADET